jgi:hypothetical protein
MVLVVPYLGMKCVESHSQEATICVRLAPIPPAPFPSPEQDFAVAYANSILELIREDLGCG